MSKQLRDLIEIIHFTERLSTKIHGLFNEVEIFKMIEEEFSKSKNYTSSILLLSNDRTKLKVAAISLPLKLLGKGERFCRLRLNEYKIDLEKSPIYQKIIKQGQTIQVNVGNLLAELFPQPMAFLISKIMGYETKKSILAPLRRDEEIIGVFAMTSTDLAEYFIPSVKNLAQHISTALELAHKCMEYKKASEALRIKDFAISSSLNGVAISDLDGRLKYVNRAFIKMIGCKSKSEILGKTPAEFVQGEYQDKIVKVKEEVKKNGVWSGDLSFKRKNGSEFCLQIWANLVKDKKGKPIFIMASVIDITKQKEIEKELRQTLESQKEFIAVVGHELRTPLSVIRALVETELDNNNVPFKEQLWLINKKVDQITEILKNLMLLSRLDIGQETLLVTKFKLFNLLKEGLEDETQGANREGVTPKIQIDCPKTIELENDWTKIAIVLKNLLQNAIFHSNGKPQISIKGGRFGNIIRITIEDNNQPIPKSEQNKIFEKFYKTKRLGRDAGLGLGLYISKRLVELMKGEIWLENKKGLGNRFTFQIPMSL